MISKEYRNYTLICDICGVGSDEEYDTFQDAADAGEDMEWKRKKIDGDWVDVCPDCLKTV